VRVRGLYRPSYSKRLPDGTRETRISDSWWLRYRVRGKRVLINLADHADGQPVRDKRVAERLAHKILSASEEKRAKLLDPFEEHERRSLSEHVKDFETMLDARGVCDGHAEKVKGYLAAFIAATKPERLSDLDGTRASEWLAAERNRGLSARSVNHERASLRQFARWLVREGRLARDPFISLGRLKEATDRRHVRRALTPSELAALIAAARRRPLEEARAPRAIRSKPEVKPKPKPKEKRRLARLGEERALVYAVAAGTGLRHGELSRLTWGDLDLERNIVNVPAASAKSRKDQWVPLRSDLAEALLGWRGPKGNAPPASARVFPSDLYPTLRTFKLDLAAAGLAKLIKRKGRASLVDTRDDRGREVDFHSLRVTFISSLAAAGVHPRVAQALARHSSIELTMKAYTDVTLLDLKGAVERIAPASSPEVARVAGA
jgi:integrase